MKTLEKSTQARKTDGDKRARQTRAKLIRVARKHFAAHGFEGASLREIQRDAGVNAAAVHYHFGSKEKLYHAVISTSVERIQTEREHAYAELNAALLGRQRLFALLRAYASPHIRLALSQEGQGYSQILIQISFGTRDRSSLKLIRESYAPTRNLFLNAIQKLLPKADPVEVARCMAAFITAMMCNPFSISFVQMTEKKLFEDSPEVWIEAVTRDAGAAFVALPGSTL